MNQVYEGLYVLGKEDELELGSLPKNQRFLKMKPFIHLRLEDAKWSNDDPVTANDFVYAWQQVASLNQGRFIKRYF